MAQMSKELMDLINSVPCCYWAMTSRDGTPNVGPIGTTSALSPDAIAAAGILMSKALENLVENPKAARERASRESQRQIVIKSKK